MSKGYLGKGWKFPIAVDPITGRIEMSEKEEDIVESIGIILATRKGERVMRPDFGSNVFEYMFSEINASTMNLLSNEIETALIKWEKRIRDVDVDIDVDPSEENKLSVTINYVVKRTNSANNLVYPFYIYEGV